MGAGLLCTLRRDSIRGDSCAGSRLTGACTSLVATASQGAVPPTRATLRWQRGRSQHARRCDSRAPWRQLRSVRAIAAERMHGGGACGARAGHV
eukprot:4335894-Prymnesium_polylepis.1